MDILLIIGVSIGVGILELLLGILCDWLAEDDWGYALSVANGIVIIMLLMALVYK